MNLKKNFLLLWVIFALPDQNPDPLTRLNPDPIRNRIRNPGDRQKREGKSVPGIPKGAGRVLPWFKGIVSLVEYFF
jgi:hypothetical protein